MAEIANAFEFSSFQSETQIGTNKDRLRRFVHRKITDFFYLTKDKSEVTKEKNE